MIYIYLPCTKHLIFLKPCVVVGIPLDKLTNEISSLKSRYLTENNTLFNYVSSMARNKIAGE